jgi:hypothetical protein
MYIKTGAINRSSSHGGNGNVAECNLELCNNSGNLIVRSLVPQPDGNNSYGSVYQGAYINSTQGYYHNQGGGVNSGSGTKYNALLAIDPDANTQASRGGSGLGLNQFAGVNFNIATGYGLGGGGGGQNASQYGGSNNGGSGGRYGYDGGDEGQDGFGPISVRGDSPPGYSYQKGAGGGFGAGVGDAGNGGQPAGASGGAILMRWDTTAANAQVGMQPRQNFPSS